MPAKAGAFHSLGYLVSLLVSGLLIEYILVYVPSFRAVSRLAGTLLTAYIDAPVEEEIAGMLVVVGLLIPIWGVGYHLYRY